MIKLVFFMYAILIPHRHPLSHWPLIGTVGRLLWLAIVVALVIVALGYDPLAEMYGWAVSAAEPPVWHFLLCGLLGLALVDSLHWVCDGFPVPGAKYKDKKK